MIMENASREFASGRRDWLNCGRTTILAKITLWAVCATIAIPLCIHTRLAQGAESAKEQPLKSDSKSNVESENKRDLPTTGCKELSAVGLLKRVKELSATVENVRAVQRFNHLPLDRTANVLVSRQFGKEIGAGTEKTKENVAYQIIVEAGKGEVQKSTLILVAEARKGNNADGSGGTDFLFTESGERTLLTFTPKLATKGWFATWWNDATIHIVGCSIDKDIPTPLFTSSIETNVTSSGVSRILAIIAVVLFYILAAAGTFQIHKAQRKKDLVQDDPDHIRAGTNYSTFWAHVINPVVLTAGSDGRGSAAKLQILFFSLLVFGLLSYIWMLTGHLSDLSTTVLLLMGIAGLGATASAGMDVSKKRLDFDNYAWLVKMRWLPEGGVAEINSASWKDIVTTEDEFDVTRFQMVTFSVLVGAALLSEGAALADLGSFSIPAALLGVLGLSQVVYLGGKLAAPPAISDLNDQIKKLRDTETKLREDISKATPDSQPGTAPDLPKDLSELHTRVGKAYEEYLDMIGTTRTMFQSALGLKVSQDKVKVSFDVLAPTIAISSTMQLPAGKVGVQYSHTLMASGGKPPYSWTSTTLPIGFSLDQSGVLSGTPATAGQLQFTVEAKDLSAATQTLGFVIDVVA